MAASPTQRTLGRLRKAGWLCQTVEQRLPRCFITRDLFGCIDVIAIKPGEPVLGVQCTSAGNVAARLAKALRAPGLRTWLACGCAFQVWGWSKRGPRGKRKLWDVTRRRVQLADLAQTGGATPDAGAAGRGA
jgi:hypothetical protein